jgi:elongation factor G
MLDAVIELMPSPIDIPPVSGTDDSENPVTRKQMTKRNLLHWRLS